MKRHSLKTYGLKKGDIVVLPSGYEEAGGTVFQIVEDTPPVEAATTERIVKRNVYDWKTNAYAMKDVKEYGAWDKKGRKIMAAAIAGFIRLKPMYSFYPSYKAKNPRGKGGTIILGYNSLEYVKLVDIVELCVKHAELADVIKAVVKNKSEDERPTENTGTE